MSQAKGFFNFSVPSLVLLFTLLPGRADGQTGVTVRANINRMIGGVSTLDRAQYFNHWGQLTPGSNTNLGDLEAEVHSPDGLHSFSGRETNDFLFAMQQQWPNFIPEDPNRPGFFNEALLVSKLQNETNTWGYKHHVLHGPRWDSLRNAENPIYVTSGRKAVYPDFIDGGNDLVTNYEGYAHLINVYLREVVYGTGPGQGYLPFDKDRFYVEIMNEPQWAINGPPANWNDVITLHREVSQLVKEEHPQAKIGGVSCCGYLNGHSANSWDRMQQMMDDMVNWQTASGESVEFDFWSIHPYEHYRVASNGSWSQTSLFSPGHLEATMDLYETYSNKLFGDPKAFAVTEYGSWNSTAILNGPGTGDDSYGNYTRAEQQWDLVRDTREKLMVFMDRPDRIVNATPFLGPRHWENHIPTTPNGDNVFWEQDAQGNWHETVVASMYRMYNDLRGHYIEVENTNPDLQTAAFRDGNKLYVVLNNLDDMSSTINLQALAGSAAVTSASLDGIFWDGSQGQYFENTDVSATWQNLTIAPEGGAVLTLTLTDGQPYDLVTDSRTFYGDDILAPINLPSSVSKAINIAADTEDALSAKLRVAFHRNGATPGESFQVYLNGTPHTISAGVLNLDENDTDMITREIDVPLTDLIDGNNQVYVDFSSNGGELITAVLEVTRSLGDFNGSGMFDGEDLSVLVSQFGAAAPDSKFDLDLDGVIDMSDVDYWLESLRGITTGLGDFDLDNDLDGDDLAILMSNYGAAGHYGLGDLDFDGDVDGLDFLHWQRLNSTTTSGGGGGGDGGFTQLPEPTTLTLAGLIMIAQLGWISNRKRSAA